MQTERERGKAPGYVIIRLHGENTINSTKPLASLYLRVVGPKDTDFDYWSAGFRFGTFRVFLMRYAWEQMRLSVQFRGRSVFVRAWHWAKDYDPASVALDTPPRT